MLYFDTSALLPYYRQEASSGRVQTLLSALSEPLLISHLTKVEMASALARWVRMQELSEPQANRVETAFMDDIDAARLLVKPVTRKDYERARQWLSSRKTALRTLDALHLACATRNRATLITLDDVLLEAARFLGLRAETP